MEFISHAWVAIHSPVGTSIIMALFMLSEALAQIPAIESNSVFQLVKKILGAMKPKK